MSGAIGKCRLAVKVSPGSSTDAIQGWLGDALKVRVTAPPERGKANRAVLQVLAAALDLPTSSLQVAAGAGRPRKIVEIDGLSEAEVRRRLDRSGLK